MTTPILLTDTTGDATRTFRYDVENRLVEAQDDGATLAAYTYDATGRRIAKQVGAQQTRYRYDGQ